MAEDTVDHAAVIGQLDTRQSITSGLQINGYHQHSEGFGEYGIYGSDAPALQQLIQEDKKYGKQLHPDFNTKTGEVVWAVRNEMARTVDDFLSRRTRILLLNARASVEAAEVVAELMAKELDKNKKWIKSQIDTYKLIAQHYIVGTD